MSVAGLPVRRWTEFAVGRPSGRPPSRGLRCPGRSREWRAHSVGRRRARFGERSRVPRQVSLRASHRPDASAEGRVADETAHRVPSAVEPCFGRLRPRRAQVRRVPGRLRSATRDGDASPAILRDRRAGSGPSSRRPWRVLGRGKEWTTPRSSSRAFGPVRDLDRFEGSRPWRLRLPRRGSVANATRSCRAAEREEARGRLGGPTRTWRSAFGRWPALPGGSGGSRTGRRALSTETAVRGSGRADASADARRGRMPSGDAFPSRRVREEAGVRGLALRGWPLW